MNGSAIHAIVKRLAPAGSMRRSLLRLIRHSSSQLYRWAARQRFDKTNAFTNRLLRHLPIPAWQRWLDQQLWYRQNEPTPQNLNEQRRRRWPAHAPRISLLIPVRERRGLGQTLATLQRQTYPIWEIILVVAADQADSLRRRFRESNKRIQYYVVSIGTAVDNCFEDARQLASGDYVCVMSAGDTLAPNALAEMAECILRHPNIDVIYCDEDCRSPLGLRHGLRLKPDWSPEMLLGFNYIGRLCLIRAASLQMAGGFDARFEDAQEYEALLRVSEQTSHIRRIAQCLYHRRSGRSSDFSYTRGSGATPWRERAVREHLHRLGHAATVATLPNGVHRVEWPIPNPPLVSIIIPTLNQPQVLKQCVEDLRQRTDYPRMEIILVDNGSTDAKVHDYYQELTDAGAATIIPFPKPFNYSEACNLGARHASGELLLFLNNDISIIERDWLTEMVRYATRPGVGCVGARLLYPNGLVQHAGVVVGLHGMVAHVNHREKQGLWTVFGSTDTYRDFLAVTGACQMIPRAVFDEVGGFDERFRIDFSDIALCLSIRRAGYRTVYSPYAALFHHESLTKGRSSPPEDTALFAFMVQEQGIIEDPYYHPALSLTDATPQLRLAPDPGPREVFEHLIHLSSAPYAGMEIDVYDDRQMLAEFEQASNLPSWRPSDTVKDEWDAARLALYLLRKSPALRQRFPNALGEGVGPYCRWLCQEAAGRYGLSAAANVHLEKAFRDNPAARVRQVYASRWREHIVHRDASMLGSRTGFALWLLVVGRSMCGFRDEEIWWFLMQTAQDPVAELIYEYSITPVWQTAFPEALTDLGWARFYRWAQPRFLPNADPLGVPEYHSPLGPLEQLRVAYDYRPAWRAAVSDAFQSEFSLRRLAAWLSNPAHWPAGEFDSAWVSRINDALSAGAAPARGVNILGHFSGPSSLSAPAESATKSLAAFAVPLTRHDVPMQGVSDRALGRPTDLHEVHDVSLIHIQPGPAFDSAYTLANLRRERDRYRVGVWHWDFSDVPAEWAKQARAVNEVWAPTRFVADALRRTVQLPVIPMLPGVELVSATPLPRSHFGIPDGRMLYLFMFDMNDVWERKNPLGLVDAFRKAFRADDNAHLAINVSGSRSKRAEYLKLRAAAAEAGVQMFDANLSYSDAQALIACCDCYVSLHRSEGFGLNMAEAMLMGKPVIATAHSGNLDFMTSDDSLLVGCELTPLETDYHSAKQGWLWAEPSLDDSVHWLRWTYQRRDDARALGERAQQSAERLLSLHSAGARMVERLEEIARLRKSAASSMFERHEELAGSRQGTASQRQAA